MPDNIKTYTNDVAAPRASETGSHAYENLARSVDNAYSEAGHSIGRGVNAVEDKIQEHMEQQDASAISAQGAKAFTDLTMSLRGKMAEGDPNQADTVATNWRDTDLQPVLDSIGADANTTHGREMAERVRNTLKEEFTKQSIGAASTIGGGAVVQNLEQTKNGLAQAVSNDPSLLSTALAYLHGTLADQLSAHKSLSAEQIARVQEDVGAKAAKDIGIAAFQTMAERNPDAAKEALTKGDFAGLFSGSEIGTLNKYADQQTKALEQKEKSQEVAVRRAQDEEFKGTVAKITTAMFQPDGSLLVPPNLPQEIIKLQFMPGASRAPGEIKSLISMVKQVNTDNAKGTKAVTDPHTYEDFNNKMLAGTLTDRDIYQARADGQMSDKDLTYFRTGIRAIQADPVRKEADKQFNLFLAGQKGAFTHTNLLTGADPRGAQNFFQFSQAARAQFDAAYKSGGLAAAQAVLQQNNSGYLGKIAPQYLSNKKGATAQSAPHFTSDAEADKGVAGLQSGMPFYGPDGNLHYKK